MKILDNKYFWHAIDKADIGGIFTKPAKTILGLDKFRITCVQIHITDKCNISCRYCYAKNHKGETFGTEKILSLISQAKELGVHEIQFVGGEPFMHPRLKELIQKTADLGLKMRIYTNGLLISDDWIEFLKGMPAILMIKLDSSNGYKYHTGKDYSIQIRKTMKSCTEKGIRVNAFIAVTSKNIEDVRELVEYTFSVGAIALIERFLPACSQKINTDLEIDSHQWRDIQKIYMGLNKAHLPKYRTVAKLLNFYCSCYNSTVSIDTDGDVLPCPYAPKELSIGNIKKSDLSVLFSIYKSKIIEWNQIPQECSSCKHANLCKGGCKTYAFLKSRNINNKDSLCSGTPPNLTMCSFNHYLFK